jgi:hypothetical protein
MLARDAGVTTGADDIRRSRTRTGCHAKCERDFSCQLDRDALEYPGGHYGGRRLDRECRWGCRERRQLGRDERLALGTSSRSGVQQ